MISSNDSIKANISPSISLGEPLNETDGGNVNSQTGAQGAWELERQQLTAQMTLLTEQLHAETAARIESQVYL